MPELIQTSAIIRDANTQSRISLDDDTVDTYIGVLLDAHQWPFPPLVVFRDGTKNFLADGFHRLEAAIAVPDFADQVPCEVKQGTAIDARIFSMTANDKHGLRPTRADKQACVEWCLDNTDMTQEEISAKAGVTSRTVRSIISKRKKAEKNMDEERGPAHENGNAATTNSPQTLKTGNFPVENTQSNAIPNSPPSVHPVAAAKSIVDQLRDKLVRAICDYHQVNPYQAERDRLVTMVQSVEVWPEEK